MAKAIRQGDSVTLTLSIDEALYVTSELAGGNSYFHGIEASSLESPVDVSWDDLPYAQLVAALAVGGERRGQLAKRYRAHRSVAEAARPQYDSEAAKAAALKYLDIELA